MSAHGPLKGPLYEDLATVPGATSEALLQPRKSKSKTKVKKTKKIKKKSSEDDEPSESLAALLYGRNGELNPDSQLAYSHDYIPFDVGYQPAQDSDEEYYLVSGPAAYGYNSSTRLPPMERHAIYGGHQMYHQMTGNNGYYPATQNYGNYTDQLHTDYPPDYSAVDHRSTAEYWRLQSEAESRRQQALYANAHSQPPQSQAPVASSHITRTISPAPSAPAHIERPRSRVSKSSMTTPTEELHEDDYLRPPRTKESRSQSPVMRTSAASKKKPSLFDNSAPVSPYSFVSLMNRVKGGKKEKAGGDRRYAANSEIRYDQEVSDDMGTSSARRRKGSGKPRGSRPALSTKTSSMSLESKEMAQEQPGNEPNEVALQQSPLWTAIGSASTAVGSWLATQYTSAVGEKGILDLVYGSPERPETHTPVKERAEWLEKQAPLSPMSPMPSVDTSVDSITTKKGHKNKSKFKESMKFVFMNPSKQNQMNPPALPSASPQKPILAAPETSISEDHHPYTAENEPTNHTDNALVSHFVDYARTWARLSFILIPVDAIADAFPSLQNLVVLIELILLMWLLYQLSILIETLATAVKAICMPIILICRLFGMYR